MIDNGIIGKIGLITETTLSQKSIKVMEIMLGISIHHTQWNVALVEYIIMVVVKIIIIMIKNITTIIIIGMI